MSGYGFTPTADQQELADSAREFGVRRLAPFYRQREREGAFDRETLREMGRMGLFGMELPEEFGGLGLDAVSAGLVLEALSESDYNIGQLSVTMALAGTIVSRYADPSIAKYWLEGLVAGELLPAIGLTEPGAGSDAATLTMRAERVGDEWVLSGEKNSVTFAKQAAFAVVWARTGTVESKAKGISAFLVPLDRPGITATEWDDMGGRSAGRGILHFDGVRIPANHLLGDEGRGFMQVMQGFDYSRALIGLQCLAVARISLEETWKAAAERQSFGKPLTSHQGVSFPLAEAEALVHACRLMCLETLWLKDNGLPHTEEAAMCKWWAPKLAFEVVQTCLLTNGHGGYSSELPYEQRLRDVLGLQIGDGTAQIMKLVIARHHAGRETS
ncbi:cyclohexanecarboxyl-CoA dehydrogenase [Subtercola boreus]|uniref:Cyclohexanecarboxyl-CoA dehydrogenase n=1 Tax=Subtercola boreus TaxID=120213 RepID=A0A3E0VL68_9MICO|nr:acyl-CoA dehydrogenase family protein [Subtercola boreus]RFA10461.1 cyclohexanecarboxyl-CoA dehydrogenase [Subtercola boreus]TQL56008.1 cyclohexanecarboxyl-CoA dehydrogenase [Subtercola boreus]